MRRLLSLLSLVLCLATTAPGKDLTVQELASFLDITSWHTVVDLPARTYVLEIYEIKDASIAAEPLLASQSEWTDTPERGFTILCTPESGKYKLGAVFSSGGTLRAQTSVPTFAYSSSESLPPKLTYGDYILFGQPNDRSYLGSNNPGMYSHGFLLRVKKP